MSKNNNYISTFVIVLTFLLLTIFVSGLDNQKRKEVNNKLEMIFIYIEKIFVPSTYNINNINSLNQEKKEEKKQDLKIKLIENNNYNELFSWEKDKSTGKLIIIFKNNKKIEIPLPKVINKLENFK